MFITIAKSKGKRFSVLPMTNDLHQALAEHPRHSKSPFVFHRKDGSPFKEVCTAFKFALEQAGLPSMRIHDLRHSFVTNLFLAEPVIDVRRIQELARHKDVRTTMNYAHVWQEFLREAIDRLRWE